MLLWYSVTGILLGIESKVSIHRNIVLPTYRNIECSKYRNVGLSISQNFGNIAISTYHIESLLLAIPWCPRVFFAHTERMHLLHVHRISKSNQYTIFIIIGTISNSIVWMINIGVEQHPKKYNRRYPTVGYTDARQNVTVTYDIPQMREKKISPWCGVVTSLPFRAWR